MVLERKNKAEGRKPERRAGGKFGGVGDLGKGQAVCVRGVCASVPLPVCVCVLVILQDLNNPPAASTYLPEVC